MDDLQEAVMRYLREGDEHDGKMAAFPMDCKGPRCTMWRLANAPEPFHTVMRVWHDEAWMNLDASPGVERWQMRYIRLYDELLKRGYRPLEVSDEG